MDINTLFKAGMKYCGRVLRVLPKNGPDGIGSPKEYMMDTLRTLTLPSLNILYPILVRKSLSTSNFIPFAENDLKRSSNMMLGRDIDIADVNLFNKVMSDDRYLMYRIPIEVTDGHEIQTIKSCVPIQANSSTVGGVISDYSYAGMPYGNRWGRTSSADIYGMALASMVDFADRQLIGSVSRNFRFYFFPPNIIAVTRAGTLNMEFCLKNDENLLTIDDMAYEGVKDLFILDLKISVYNEYGDYGVVSGPSGDYDLNIQDWASADGDRKELYARLRSKSHIRNSTMRS